MPDFKGLNDWFEIIHGGKQTCSEGKVIDCDALIDKAAASFNASRHEPPIVLGHPKDDSPAFGWVDALKIGDRNGTKVLLAKCKQVVPEFGELVQRGLYKKRSAAFYADGRLRHVGFLGAMPPAVKGLREIEFSEPADAVFEFSENRWSWQSVARLFRNLREWMIENSDQEKADRVLPDYAIEDIAAACRANDSPEVYPGFTERKEKKMKFSEFFEALNLFKKAQNDPDFELPAGKPSAPAGGGKTFSEAEVQTQLEAAKKLAEADARKAVEAEFAEKNKKAARESRLQALKAWFGESLKAGKIAPAWEKMGLLQFMEGLDSEGTIEFAEGEKSTPSDWMKKFLAELPKVIEFKEVAGRDKDVSGSAGGKLDTLVKAKREKEPSLSFSEALTIVQRENPELANEYAQGLRG